MVTEDWKTLAAKKKAQQIEAIPKEWLIKTPATDVTNVLSVPKECGLLSAKELEITELKDVADLLAKLAKGDWTALEVTTAYYKRAIVAHQLTNCLTEIYIDKALAWASDLDARFKETGKPVGPLHGLPISLKDQFCIEGMDTVMGYVAWIDKPAQKSAVLVDILLEAGAVPFVRTNVPQTLMWPETYNIIYGRTTNPANRTLTCGGSSGGEGALVALGGSPLGVGTDIGGSVRIPAGLNGLYGLRPSYNRFPYQDAVNSAQGQESVCSVLGPITPSVSGLGIFARAVLAGKPWLYDPLCVRKAWDESSYKLEEHGMGKKMCFAFMWDDGLVKPHPPVLRALGIAKKALEAAGHTVIDWEPPAFHQELVSILSSIYSADGGEDFKEVTKESQEPYLSTMIPVPDEAAKGGVGKATPGEGMDSEMKGLFGTPTALSAYELFQIQWRKRALQKKYLDLWMATVSKTGTGRPIDAIIMPMAPYAAPPHGHNTYVFYTSICNILDYAAAVFPVTTVDPALDKPAPAHKFRTPEDQLIYQLYSSPDVFKDAPVNLQLVGQKLEEEAVIGMTEVVAKALAAHS